MCHKDKVVLCSYPSELSFINFLRLTVIWLAVTAGGASYTRTHTATLWLEVDVILIGDRTDWSSLWQLRRQMLHKKHFSPQIKLKSAFQISNVNTWLSLLFEISNNWIFYFFIFLVWKWIYSTLNQKVFEIQRLSNLRTWQDRYVSITKPALGWMSRQSVEILAG